ncbi:MAG: hypothetical protein V1727_01840 [Candidatus Omnitrophota bacterium]
MLKRYQVILNDWQADHYRLIAQKYDVSFSEMLRMALCLDILYATKKGFPNYRPKVTDKLLSQAIKTHKISETMNSAQFHNFLSLVYFETRKATELWVQQGK